MGTVTIDRPRPVPRPIVHRSVAELTAMDVAPNSEATILVVDHHRSFADMLAQALNGVAGMRCVGTAATASEAVAVAGRLQPDIVALDIQMPVQDGLRAIHQIRKAAPNTAVAVVTGYCDAVWITRAAQAGASAFILKDGSLTEMLDVLRRVRHGQMIVAPAAFRGTRSTAGSSSSAATPALTPRELDVLRCLGKAMTAAGIARVLGITLHTCRGHLKAVHNKLGASSQLEAVIKAQQLGLIATS